MGVEGEKPVQPEKSSEIRKSIDVFAANRRFERFLGINSNDLREDQRGNYYPFEQEEFRQQRKPAEINPEEGKLICTVTFKPDERTITYDYPDGSRIEEGPNGRIETPPQSK